MKRVPFLFVLALLVAWQQCPFSFFEEEPLEFSSDNKDFGDAPDPDFPTLLASNGARTGNPLLFWLGEGATLEKDAQVVDKDTFDDGLVEISFRDRKVILTFRVLRRPEAEKRRVFFNLLVDLNADGRWGSDEHVVVNREVDLVVASVAGEEVEFERPEKGGNIWIRAAVTDSQVEAGWTGTGLFLEGEVEDHLLKLEPTTGIPPEPTPTPAIGITPEQTVTDPGEDTYVCATQETETYPAADITEVKVFSTEEGMRVEVVLAQSADISLDKEFSWAVVLFKQDKDGKARTFLMEIHDGAIRQGELDQQNNIIPDTEEMADVEEGMVVFRPDQKLEDTQSFFVQTFNLPEEGDEVGCDEASWSR